MCGGAAEGYSWEGVAVQDWSAAQVLEWLSTAEGGRFSHVVVPEGTTGKELLGMNGAALGALFAGAGREGRASNEGSVWTIEAMGGRGLAKEMVAALRREACRWRIG